MRTTCSNPEIRISRPTCIALFRLTSCSEYGIRPSIDHPSRGRDTADADLPLPPSKMNHHFPIYRTGSGRNVHTSTDPNTTFDAGDANSVHDTGESLCVSTTL